MMTSRRLAAACVLGIGLSGCGRLRSALTHDEAGAASASAESSLAFLSGFEGDIGLSMKGKTTGKAGGAPVALDLHVKTGKVRADLPEGLAPSPGSPGAGGKVSGILDSQAKKLILLLEAQKQAVVIDLNKAGEQLKGFKPPPPSPHAPQPPPEPPPKVTKTGRNDTVAGYSCEEWDVVDKDSKAEICVAHEGVTWFSLPITGIPTEHAWAAELLDGKHFPLRFIGYDKTGAEEGRVEVTHIDKKPQDDTLFQVPPGYKTVDIEQMFQGLGPGGPGGLPGHHGPPHR